ncbi:hypothetical protein CSKR_106153 [Clonorchis sinensis]|uniref:Uncharacterized protein n=1 Tax=Clonorchis sinensis TaxID=79923 RepID=A0A419PJL1_CLOSI|nr:hypothetical protein CSKR_106153 [Clonorchis sinensis]
MMIIKSYAHVGNYLTNCAQTLRPLLNWTHGSNQPNQLVQKTRGLRYCRGGQDYLEAKKLKRFGRTSTQQSPSIFRQPCGHKSPKPLQ